jgi:serine protease Do
LQSRDVIQEIDGVPLRGAEDLYLYIGSALAGTRVQLKIARKGSDGVPYTPEAVTVTLAKFHHTHPYIASVRPPAVHGLRVEYSSILAQQLNNGNGFRTQTTVLAHQGVVVRELEPNSPAEAAFKGLGGNDVTRWMITAVNGTQVSVPDEFYRAAKGRSPVRLAVVNPTQPDATEKTITLP